jgi:hypothetical protein
VYGDNEKYLNAWAEYMVAGFNHEAFIYVAPHDNWIMI